MNNISLTGRLTKKPEAHAYSGSNKTTFNIAVDRVYAKEGQQKTDFIPVEIWGKVAENCIKYLDKGSLVGVSGELRIDMAENNHGQTVKFTKVLATKVDFLSNKSAASSEPTNCPEGFKEVDESEIPF